MNHLTYSHCISSLHYIYQILGEDTFMQEVAFLRHGKQKEIEFLTKSAPPSNPIQSVVEPPSDPIVHSSSDKVIVHKQSTNELDQEEIPQKKKYSRAIVPDQDRCQAIISSGSRCTCTKVNDQYCNRHSSK